jgi:serine/threonine protein kinase
VENYTAENGYLSETEALRYIDQIGQALECVHERKLLHRDVKPNNILLRRKTKEAVLIDFGLAREFQPGKIRSMTATKTEGYAPIEQYERRGDFGYYTDVYALAATLYSLLTNRVPIPANYRAEEDVKLSPPQKYNQNISDKVNAAILKGMELEPVNRPQTVREFRELLGLVVKPVVNIPTPPPINYSSVDYGFLDYGFREKQPQNISTPQPVNQEVQLKSSCGMYYSKLRDLLTQGKWLYAERETDRIMLALMKREQEGYLLGSDFDNFPCEDLRTIDQLWVKYSDAKFGFSIQKKIYQSLSGTIEYNDTMWEKFKDKVGWKERQGRIQLDYDDITFDKKAPEGHLPFITYYSGVSSIDFMGFHVGCRLALFSRVETCKL